MDIQENITITVTESSENKLSPSILFEILSDENTREQIITVKNDLDALFSAIMISEKLKKHSEFIDKYVKAYIENKISYEDLYTVFNTDEYRKVRDHFYCVSIPSTSQIMESKAERIKKSKKG